VPQQATYAAQQNFILFDQVVGERKQIVKNREIHRLRGFIFMTKRVARSGYAIIPYVLASNRIL
jgi:hypothetical protein